MNRVYKALAHPARRRVLRLLREQPMTAGEIAGHFELADSTLSGHFSVLKQADLIHGDREGSSIVYSLNASLLEEALLSMLETFGVAPDHGAEADDRAGGRTGAEPDDTESEDTESEGTESEDTESEGTESDGTESDGTEPDNTRSTR